MRVRVGVRDLGARGWRAAGFLAKQPSASDAQPKEGSGVLGRWDVRGFERLWFGTLRSGCGGVGVWVCGALGAWGTTVTMRSGEIDVANEREG